MGRAWWAIAVACVGAQVASAQVTGFDLFKNLLYDQTSSTQPTTPSGAFVGSRVDITTPADAAAVTGTSSSAGALVYPRTSATEFEYRSPTYASGAAQDAAFAPGSSLGVTVSGGTLGTQTANVTLAADTYSSAIPYLTGGSYAALQSFDASRNNTLTINGFTSPANATEAFAFITVFRLSDGAAAYSLNFAPSATTAFTIAAGTLAANTAYTLDIDYSARLGTANAGFGGAAFVQGFDRRTEVAFTTLAAAVPEPSAWTLMLGGFALVGTMLRRRPRGLTARG